MPCMLSALTCFAHPLLTLEILFVAFAIGSSLAHPVLSPFRPSHGAGKVFLWRMVSR